MQIDVLLGGSQQHTGETHEGNHRGWDHIRTRNLGNKESSKLSRKKYTEVRWRRHVSNTETKSQKQSKEWEPLETTGQCVKTPVTQVINIHDNTETRPDEYVCYG